MNIFYKKLTDNKGQSVLETALVMPIILLLIMAVISISMMLYTKMLVVLSASQGARVASQVWRDETLMKEEKDEKIEKIIMGILSNGTKGVDRSWNAEEINGTIHVTVKYKFKLILPFLSKIFKENEVLIKHEAQYYIE